MKPPIPPEGFDLNSPENKIAFGPLPKCEHGLIKNLCDVCIEVAKAGVKV